VNPETPAAAGEKPAGIPPRGGTATVVLVALYRFQNFPVRILHALLERLAGVRVHTIFFKNYFTNALHPPTRIEEALFRDRIRELDPALVGFSVYSPYVSIARRLGRIVKESSSAAVVWGGIHPTLFPEESLREADIVCMGEGEEALVELVTALRDGRSHAGVRNLWAGNGDAAVKNPMRPLIQDLDALPFPAYGREGFDFIQRNAIGRRDPVLTDPNLFVLPARGCPFTCTYCVNSLLRPLFKDLGPYVRRRSAANVIAEIAHVLALPGCRKEVVEFHDENFGTDAAWLEAFESAYPASVGLPFKVQYNPTLVKPQTIERLARIGLHRVKFGIEAGTDEVRNRVFRRPGKNAEILKLAQAVSRMGIHVRYDLIIDNPYDTVESLRETLRLLLALPRPLRFNLYALQYFPGYPLTERAVADGCIPAEEASLESLQKKMARHWAFVPRLLPASERRILESIIWLIAQGRVDPGRIERAVFGCGPLAALRRGLLHVEAYFRGKVQMARRLAYRREY
jgi:radical SAM superfamily enzyme YgiQ (UPF0313 family)